VGLFRNGAEEEPGMRFRRPRVLLVVCAVTVPVGLLAAASASVAATPSGGVVAVGHPAKWTFAPVGGPSGATDSFLLTVKLPAAEATLYAADLRTGTDYAAVLTIRLTWKGTSPDDTLGLSATDPGGAAVGDDTSAVTSNGGDTNIFMLQDPLSQQYTITASSQLGTSSTAVPSQAVATLQVVHLAAIREPAASPGGPGFTSYPIPLSLMPPTAEEQQLGGRVFGEPSAGVDPRTGATMYQAGLYTMKAIFNTSASPATVRWSNVSSPLTSTFSEDAILAVDRATGRTIVSQLALACSISAFSDNDGGSWTPAAKACQTPPAVDHQTIGAGPFAPPLTGTVYPDAVYYCSQNIAYAACALSLDGGVTYGHGLSPMFTSAQCFGLHGHVKVAPDGTVYVPDKACGAPECLILTSTATPGCHPGFAVSTNDGQTWTVHTINDGHTRYFDTGDPSIGIGADGTMYYGYGNANGHPMIAVCTDHGATCGPSADVGTAFHIANTEMATVVAGDGDRAAFAFLGSTTPGDDQQNNVQVTDANGNVVNRVFPWHDFMGTWHLYIAVTYDRGRHWTTVDATPGAPVQRGCIEFGGNCPSTRGSNDQRNLLDFNDLTIDREGRIIAAYTDGCQPDLGPPASHGTCLTDATRLSGLAPEIEGPAVLRQSCGLGLYAKFDSLMNPCT
jgi:hypothetical protein